MKRMFDRLIRMGRRGLLAVLTAAALAIAVGYVSGGWNALLDLVFPQDPVSARVETDPVVLDSTLPYEWERYDYVIPAAPANIPPPPKATCRNRFRWARKLDGFNAYRTKIRVYLEGKSDREVIIDGAAVKTEHKNAPRAGTHVACPVGGATLNPIHLYVNLDRGTSRYGRIDEPERPFLFKLAKGERQALEIQAHAQRYDVRWWLELSVLDGDDRRTVRIDDDGEPFRTSAAPPTTVMWDGRRWRRDPSLRLDAGL